MKKKSNGICLVYVSCMSMMVVPFVISFGKSNIYTNVEIMYRDGKGENRDFVQHLRM